MGGWIVPVSAVVTLHHYTKVSLDRREEAEEASLSRSVDLLTYTSYWPAAGLEVYY